MENGWREKSLLWQFMSMIHIKNDVANVLKSVCMSQTSIFSCASVCACVSVCVHTIECVLLLLFFSRRRNMLFD